MNPYRKYIEPEKDRLARIKAEAFQGLKPDVVDICLFALCLSLFGLAVLIS